MCGTSRSTEVTIELQNELHSKLQSELQNKLKSELEDVQNELQKLQNELKSLNSRVRLRASEPSQDKGQLKRNVRQADEDTDTPSATEILTNALTEIIGRKLVSYMDCNKNEYNHTKCSLKPGPKDLTSQLIQGGHVDELTLVVLVVHLLHSVWVVLNAAECVVGHSLAYRFGRTFSFSGYSHSRFGIDAQYVDGLSLTHGAPGSRQHIWTFASGFFTGNENSSHPRHRCPCDNGNTSPSPPFVANDYFCESIHAQSSSQRIFYPNAPLWDGLVCEGGGTCCKLNNPPWFTKNLANSTTEDIEL